MFRRAPSSVKTSAPLKNSDRRKLKQRVIDSFGLLDDPNADLLVPEGLQSLKLTTHSGEQGLAYLSADGDPLWFTLGKESNDLIPTVYTLWKSPRIIPFLSIPPLVIPILLNGADLMIAGVVEHNGNPRQDQLVAVTVHEPGAIAPAYAVGRMALDVERLKEPDVKGKAVIILHIYGDKLWQMGKGSDLKPPASVPWHVDSKESQELGSPKVEDVKDIPAETIAISDDTAEGMPLPPPELAPTTHTISSSDVSAILRGALLQALCTSLSSLPPSAYPVPSTTFYTTHILPARPTYVPVSPTDPSPTTTPIDIKHSAYKNLTAFLRAAEKEGLLRLKEVKGKGKSSGGDVLVLGVSPEHPDVRDHSRYKTIGEADAKKEKKEEREAEEASKVRERVVTELWKPHQQTLRLFEERGKDSTALYTLSEVKAVLNDYITDKTLVNPHQQQFINVDDLLHGVLASKNDEVPEFMKRDELMRRLVEKMQPWHSIQAGEGEPALKKGKLEPISIAVKIRQGRKACTLLTRFEPFGLDADALAEELRRLCASSTAITPLPGRGAGLEVMVQGKQIKSVTEALIAKGVPKKWIEAADLTEKKK